nr:hypothetical protein [Thermoanaerobacter siderophilus]
MATMAVALAMGLHTTHILVPPTPGPLVVTGILGADLGTVIVISMLVSIPVMLAGCLRSADMFASSAEKDFICGFFASISQDDQSTSCLHNQLTW